MELHILCETCGSEVEWIKFPPLGMILISSRYLNEHSKEACAELLRWRRQNMTWAPGSQSAWSKNLR